MTGNDGAVKQATENKETKLERSLRGVIPLSFGEEVGNSVSHGVAALIFIFLLPFTAVYMYIEGASNLQSAVRYMSSVFF